MFYKNIKKKYANFVKFNNNQKKKLTINIFDGRYCFEKAKCLTFFERRR